VVLGITPIACLALLLYCLEKFAAKAVRESGSYLVIYLSLGAAILGVSSLLFSFLGIGARDDVLERRNRACLIAIVGALLGAAFCVAGGNIGEGPGIAAVLESAGAALITWFFLWYFADLLSGISDRITVERDDGSGVRLAGLLAANGVLLGAAAAGDWIPGRLLHDFALSAWPALLLSGSAIVVERISTPRTSVARSALAASAYLLAAGAWVAHRGLGS